MIRSLFVYVVLVSVFVFPFTISAEKVLNNFVTEILNRNDIHSDQTIRFINPREGWVFFSLVGGGDVKLYLGNRMIVSHKIGKAQLGEAMQYLKEGAYILRITSTDSTSKYKLIVRLIPEIMYNAYRRIMNVPELSSQTWDWSFMRKYVLPNVNVLIVSRVSQKPEDEHIKEWTARGGRWINAGDVPFNVGTVEEAYEWFISRPGFSEPYYAGYLADEFCAREDTLPKTLKVISALERIFQNPKFKGKLFYPYTESPTQPFDDFKYLCKFVVQHKFLLAREWYCAEKLPKKNMFDCFDPPWHAKNRKLWREKYPGAENSRIMVFGAQGLPYMNMDTNPGLDYKVWLDWQFKFVATDPSFRGIRGVMCYNSSYQGEELVRWTCKLYRHYCIEGKTNLLSNDPYVLTHIKNPDFEKGTEYWTLNPAEEGSIYASKMEKYGRFQGRFADNIGDYFLVTRRSDKGPNVFSQTVRNLKPGRLYTFRMYTSDYSGIKRGATARVKHAVSINIEDAKILKRVQHIYYSRNSSLIKSFSRKKAWLNFHWVLFSANSHEAKLVISDWIGKQNPGGPVGQEIAFNFIQIQPYFERED